VLTEFNHYGIVIRDLRKSLAFYQDILGAKIVFQGLIPSTRTDVVYLQIAGGLIELLHRAEPAPDEVFGVTTSMPTTRASSRRAMKGWSRPRSRGPGMAGSPSCATPTAPGSS